MYRVSALLFLCSLITSPTCKNADRSSLGRMSAQYLPRIKSNGIPVIWVNVSLIKVIFPEGFIRYTPTGDAWRIPVSNSVDLAPLVFDLFADGVVDERLQQAGSALQPDADDMLDNGDFPAAGCQQFTFGIVHVLVMIGDGTAAFFFCADETVAGLG